MKKGLKQGRKKLLFLITKSNWGGAQRYVYDLATNVPSDQFEPVVALGPAAGSEAPGALAERLAAAGIRTIFVPELSRDMGVTDVSAYRAISRIIGDEQPDIVHLNSSKAGGLGALSARMHGTPRVIFTAHGWPFREARNPLSKALIWCASLATVLLSHKTICVSEADRHAFATIPFMGRKLIRIYNGIDLSAALGSGVLIREAFPPGTFITGTIGELTANKNQTALIEAAKNDAAMHVAIVGEGEDHSMLQRLIGTYGLASRVKLFGFIPAVEALKGFDAFVLPSRKEGLPYVLIEAKRSGLPITANRTGGVGEILDLPLETFALSKMIAETIALYNAPMSSV
jgi:glycosyltransferase involved in cell wall biosynthesis